MGNSVELIGIVRLEPDGTRRRTGGEVKWKNASGVGSQQSCTLPQNMVYPALEWKRNLMAHGDAREEK